MIVAHKPIPWVKKQTIFFPESLFTIVFLNAYNVFARTKAMVCE